jgi:DNA-binding Xre family transcriptional regulator
MITGRQIAAALALLGWDNRELVQRTGLSRMTVLRVVSAENVPRVSTLTLELVERALTDGGAMFLDIDGAGGIGVRLTKQDGVGQ